MASCQTWSAASTHIRHPWFDTTIMKRKHRDIVSPDEEEDIGSAAPRVPLPKRRRCSNLEHGFAQMSLGISDLADIPVISVEPPSTNVVDADMLPASPSTHLSTSAPVHQIPYTVEEPPAPEVKMKALSWYEPEPDRIVITDLDSFTEEDEEQDENVSINPVLLDAIRSNTIETSTTKPPTTSTSQALVLFRPLPICDIKKDEEEPSREEEEVAGSEEKMVDEDAMDVED